MTNTAPSRRTVLAGGVACAAAAAPLAVRARVPRREADAPMIGVLRPYTCREDDTLLDVARRFGLGYTEMIAANRDVDPWLPGAGTEIQLPTAHLLPDTRREGLALNLADQRLYRFRGGRVSASYAIGIGRQGWETPTGHTQITEKTVDPIWHPPESIRAEQPDLPERVPPGENNPLGHYAIDLRWPTYLIHGTNMPWGIGRRISHGCIRLYPESIARLFNDVSVGEPVHVVDQPAKLGWVRGRLLLEVHPNQAQASALLDGGAFESAVVPGLPRRIVEAVQGRGAEIDWRRVERLMAERRGVPEPVAGGKPLG